MTRAAITETIGLITRVAAALGDVATSADIDRAADLRRALGALVDLAEVNMRRRTMGTALQSAFAAATAAGATADGMDRVRAVALAEPAVTNQARAARVACERLALIGIGMALTEATFKSREDVQAMLARVNDAFSPAIDDAADAGQNVVYRDLVALHAAVTRDLTQRGRPLPRMVPYSFPRRLPTLTISQRLYGAGDRADEVAGENKVVHPLFAPSSGRALSA